MILSIGLDLVAVKRFNPSHFSERQAAWFARRIFTETEIAYAAGKRHPRQHLAGAFAAKEAFRKALGESAPWREVGVVHNTGGAPILRLSEGVQAKLSAFGEVVVHLSISHTDENAAATVIIERLSLGAQVAQACA
jgi:holo-[acyl-carrier protein] synthase